MRWGVRTVSIGWVAWCMAIIVGSGLAEQAYAMDEPMAMARRRDKKKKGNESDGKSSSKGGFGGLASHSEVVGGSVRVDSGLVVVHQMKDDYLWEIPFSVIGCDLLLVNKVSGVSAKLNETGLNKGINYRNMLLRLEHRPEAKRLMVVEVSPEPECAAGDAICASMQDNYLSTPVESLEIKAYAPDSGGVIVSVKELFDGSNSVIQNVFGVIGLGTSPVTSLSYIEGMKSFAENVVVRSHLTTRIPGAEENAHVTVLVTSNLVKLPEEPMVPRFDDERVGYFSEPKLYYRDAQQRVDKRQVITRWRMEPRDEDKERYLAGELVVPKKPIVFYLDPAIPTQWRSYLKEGIEAWLPAFERAGFRDAIEARDVDSTVADFDVDDARYSSLVYAASEVANAMGPSVMDPRTGEILESDIIWWHNVLDAVRRWLRVQVGLLREEVQGNEITEEAMGNAVRYIVAHEVGHTLGLMHNMAGSYAFSIDSLRSPSFTAKHGTSSSIMDYARFNYVAQPQDGIKQLIPVVGEYDKYVIEFGYRWRPVQSPYEELESNEQFLAKHASDATYFFGPQAGTRDVIDPRSQAEDLGDDAVAASRLGLKSLRALMGKVLSWTEADKGNYVEAGKFLHDIIDQWHLYAYHVLANVGGIYLHDRISCVEKSNFEHVPLAKQREAVRYLAEEVFTYPEWLFGGDIYKQVYPVKNSPAGPYEYAPMELYKNYQGYILWDMLTDERLARMLENEAQNGKKAYTVLMMFDDVHKVLFAKTQRGAPLTVYERIAQKGYVDALIIACDRGVARKEGRKLYGEPLQYGGSLAACMLSEETMVQERGAFESAKRRIKFDQLERIGDQLSLKRGELKRIYDELKRGLQVGDKATRYHYYDLMLRIEDALGEN